MNEQNKQALDILIPASERYQCPCCCSLHHEPFDAQTCCPVDEEIVFYCPTCDKHFDEQKYAFNCCNENQSLIDDNNESINGAIYQATHAELESAGQVRLFE